MGQFWNVSAEGSSGTGVLASLQGESWGSEIPPASSIHGGLRAQLEDFPRLSELFPGRPPPGHLGAKFLVHFCS